MKQLDVFITSTCYDLIDLRAELAQFLRDRGFLVRLSEDPMSDFSVEPTADSIESCLANVEAADVLICVIDRRYGGVLTSGRYKGKSATHAEVEHARSLSPPKPVFFFLRDRAANDYGFLRDNGPGAKTRWLEEKGEEHKKRWLDFVAEVSRLPKHEGLSNWYDPFRDSVELKRLVLKRLSDRFPQAVASLAMAPDRLVRVTFAYDRAYSGPEQVGGRFLNVGVGPAMNLTYGYTNVSLCLPIRQWHIGGVADGDGIFSAPNGFELTFPSEKSGDVVVFCEYENRFGDRYRVEQSFVRPSPDKAVEPDEGERLFVAVPGAGNAFEWRQVYPISDL